MPFAPFAAPTKPALIRLWNASLTHDPLAAAVLRTRVLLDPNFQPEGLLVAEGGGASGWVCAEPDAPDVPLFLQGLEPDARLDHGLWRTPGLATAGDRDAGSLRRRWRALPPPADSRSRLHLTRPTTLFPGVDIDAYAPALQLSWKCQGWQTASTPISMRAELTGFQLPAEIGRDRAERWPRKNVAIRPVTRRRPARADALHRGDKFGWDWYQLCAGILCSRSLGQARTTSAFSSQRAGRAHCRLLPAAPRTLRPLRRRSERCAARGSDGRYSFAAWRRCWRRVFTARGSCGRGAMPRDCTSVPASTPCDVLR
jgi:hypothetical protein